MPTDLSRGVFLDRDGTVIEEKHYLSTPEGVVLLPTVGETIARLNRLGIRVVVVTNQAGIARGYFPESCIPLIHARLDELLVPFGARIDRYEYCPHHPTEGQGVYKVDCACRKPRPGMLKRAAVELGVTLSRSLMVGDRVSDVQAGYNAGCRSALVQTGYGSTESLDRFSLDGFTGSFASLGDAVTTWLQTDLEQILPVH